MERSLSRMFMVALVSGISFAFPHAASAAGGGVPGQIAALEDRATAAEAAITAAQSAITALNAQTAAQAAQIAAQAAQIAAQAAQTTAQAGQIASLQVGVVPVGTTIPFAAETPPAGYLECDGSPVSRTTYAALFAVIGTAFGAGDGSSTFNLPDFRGQFPRGWAHGSGNDPDRGNRFRFFAGGALGDHVGTYQFYQVQSLSFFSGALNIFGPFDVVSGGNSIGSNLVQLSNGSETRPRNLGVMFAIKY